MAQIKGADKKRFEFIVSSSSQREKAASMKAAAQISPVVAAATSAAQVVTATQPLQASSQVVTGTQQLSKVSTPSQLTMRDRGLKAQEYADKFAQSTAPHIDEFMIATGSGMKTAKTGMYKFGKLSYEIAGQGITSGTPYVTGFFGGIHTMLPYRLIFMFLFFFVFYRIIYNICIFFGIDQIILSMYMGWVSFIIVLFTFLPYDYGNILDE